MTRVLHILDGFGTGGAETWLVECVKYIHNNPQLELQFDFLCTGGEKRFFDDEVLSCNAKIFYVKFSFKRLLSFRNELKRILKANSYDVFHNHGDFISAWNHLPLVGLLPKMVISHVHVQNSKNFRTNYIASPRRMISYFLGRKLNFLLSSKITGTSDHVMNSYGYHKWPYKYKRTKPTYCGIDVDKFRFTSSSRKTFRENIGVEESDKVILFAGRVGLYGHDLGQNEKNSDFAVQLAMSISKKHEGFYFYFAGVKGNQGESWEKKVKQSGLETRIKFLGVRNDVNLWMNAADFLVFPSFWEGLGMVAVEAQVNGLPVLMSEGVPEEAIFNKNLVKRLSITNGTGPWETELLNGNLKRNLEFRPCLKNISFTIENSVLRMKSLYLTGI